MRSTTDGHEMISWIQDMKQEGGGDCPEFSFHGLLAGTAIDILIKLFKHYESSNVNQSFTSLALSKLSEFIMFYLSVEDNPTEFLFVLLLRCRSKGSRV